MNINERVIDILARYSDTGTLILDNTFKLININSIAYKIIGKSESQLKGKYIFDIMTIFSNGKIVDHQLLSELIETADETIELSVQTRLEHSDLVSAIIAKTHGKDRQFIMFLRKLYIDKNTLETMKKYQAYVENAPDGVFIADKQGRYLEVNNAACRITGYSSEELTKMSIRDITYSEDTYLGIESFNKLINNGSTHDELRFVKKDGTIGYWSIDAVKIDNNNYLGFTKDITDKKIADNELLSSRAELKSIFDNMMNAFVMYESIFDNKGVFINCKYKYINKAYENLTGKEKSTVIGKTINDVWPGTDKQWIKTYGEVAASGISQEFIMAYKPNKRTYHCNVYRPGSSRDTFCVVFRDITEHHEAEMNIKESEKKFRLLAENSIDCIWSMNKQLRFTYLSPSLYRMTGYHPEEWIGTHLAAHFTRKEFFKAGIMAAKAIKHYKTFDSVNFTTKMLNKNNEEIPVEITGRVVIDEKGNLVGLQGATRDIKERVKSENRLIDSEMKYKELFDNTPIGIFRTNSEGRSLQVNYAMARILGFNDTKKTLEHFHDLGNDLYLNPERRKEFIALIKEKGEVEHFEYQAKKADGSIIWLSMNARISNLNEDGTFIIDGFTMDITKRKAAEEQLIKSEELYSTIVETASEGIWMIDSNAYTVFVNKAMADMLEYSIDEMMGRQLFDFMDRDSKHIAMLKFNDRKKGENETHDFIFKTKSGKDVFTLLNTNALFNQSEFEGALAMITNITEIKNQSEQLQRSQRLETVGTLASGIAHDFNNILTPIMGYSDIILNECDNNSEIYKDILEIKKAADMGHSIVNQMLGYTRKNQDVKHMIDLKNVINDVLFFMKSNIPVNIVINKYFEKKESYIFAVLSQIHQIIINLIKNSCQAMPEGGIINVSVSSIISRDECKKTNVKLEKGQYVKISVNDTGEGMDKNTLEHIWEPFFTTKKPELGTGLGLSVVHDIISEHEGLIDIKSEIGKGTTVVIYLPKQKIDINTVNEQYAAKPLLKGENQKILIIDDDRSVSELMKRMLEKLGYLVFTENNALQFSRNIRNMEINFDAIITDLTMPGISGVELASIIKEKKKDIPIILISGYGAEFSGRNANIDAAMGKPIKIKILAETLSSVLNRNNNA